MQAPFGQARAGDARPCHDTAGSLLYDSDVSSDEEVDYDLDPKLTLGSIEHSKTIHFSIRSGYTNKWKPREAFRELVQNWRDGIIKSFELGERDFCAVRSEKTSGRNTEIVYKVLHLRPRAGHTREEEKACLGYIRYQGRDGYGTIDICNRSAVLQPWHLDMGGTTKTNDEQQAGAHGEGLKIALLALMRRPQNHSVRCISGGFNWVFNFSTSGRLVARLRRMSPERIQKLEQQARERSKRTLLPFASCPAHDVQFIIGEKQAGARNEGGQKVQRDMVSLEAFEHWTTAALFLHHEPHQETATTASIAEGSTPGPSNRPSPSSSSAIISTRHGGLLTGEKFRGSIYLKGLLLRESEPSRSASITNRPLRYGYNFAKGATNRERESVAVADEESRSILAIWKQVVATQPAMVRELSDMLNDPEPQCADVAGARRHLDDRVLMRLADYLVGEEFAGKWYYCAEDKIKNPRLGYIIQGLGYEGVELSNTYWQILAQKGFLRTAEEEEKRRFMVAQPAEMPETSFATSIDRLLRACLRGCPMAGRIPVQFVQAGLLHLQLFYSKGEAEDVGEEKSTGLFRVHERWLSADCVVQELGLSKSQVETGILFHAVKRLFADALEQLPLDLFHPTESDQVDRSPEGWRKLEISRAEQRLLNCLLTGLVMDVNMDGARTLRVNWAVDRWHADTEVEIQCHRASRCSGLARGLLTAEDARSDKMACFTGADDGQTDKAAGGLPVPQHPPCRVSRVSYRSGVHYESELEEDQQYFFVFANPAESGAIVSLSDRVTVERQPTSSPVPLRLDEDGDTAMLADTGAPAEPATGRETPGAGSSSGTSHSDLGLDLDIDTSSEGHGEIEAGIGQPRTQPERAPNAAGRASLGPAGSAPPARVPVVAVTNEPSVLVQATTSSGTFTLGHLLESLDMFEIDTKRCYEAKSSENVRAVIAMLKGEKILATETRKRRRADDRAG